MTWRAVSGRPSLTGRDRVLGNLLDAARRVCTAANTSAGGAATAAAAAAADGDAYGFDVFLTLITGCERAGEGGCEGGKALHSSTFRLNVTQAVWDTLDGVSESITKMAQVELKSGGVEAPN
jgi:hypothetical protein